jgi:hypothetical protein
VPSPVHPYSDYGVALRTLRSARSWLNFVLVLCVIAQFVGFALMWWTPQPYKEMKAQWMAASQPAAAPLSLPAEVFYPGVDENHRLNIHEQWAATYALSVPVTQIGSLLAVTSQVIIVFVTLLVVLVAQAPGVAQITRALIWSVLLLFMFLPWQYFAKNFPIPGIMYSYAELVELIGPLKVPGGKAMPIMYWLMYGRFILWPILGMLVMIITGERFRAGIMLAIGHPLQSMMQPRAGAAPISLPGAARSLPPMAPPPMAPRT